MQTERFNTPMSVPNPAQVASDSRLAEISADATATVRRAAEIDAYRKANSAQIDDLARRYAQITNGSVGDSHDSLTFHDLSEQVGDITSTAKGSGARYNNGKTPLDLVPLTLLAGSFADNSCGSTVAPINALGALFRLGEYQARKGSLTDVLDALGLDGWAECAEVFAYGKAKYAAWNWAKGMTWSVPLACAARHLVAMIHGEVKDPESGLPHRGHVFCNIVMLLTYATTFPEGDDLPAAGMLL